MIFLLSPTQNLNRQAREERKEKTFDFLSGLSGLCGSKEKLP